MILDEFAHIKVTSINVFHLGMMFRVVCHINGRAVVHVQIRGGINVVTEFFGKSAEVNRFLTGVASQAATISASQEERAMLFCFLEPQETAAWFSTNTQPEVECLTAQSESE